MYYDSELRGLVIPFSECKEKCAAEHLADMYFKCSGHVAERCCIESWDGFNADGEPVLKQRTYLDHKEKSNGWYISVEVSR